MTNNKRHIVYIGIGANKGNRKRNINFAVKLLSKHPKIKVLKVSSLLKNPPQEGIKNGYFLNGVLKLTTSLKPIELLKYTNEIEKKLGRKVKSSGLRAENLEHTKVPRQWTSRHQDLKTSRPQDILTKTSRTIDLDILFYDDKVIKTKTLIIPHPKLHLRYFVLIPLFEIAKNFKHPIFRKKVKELYENYFAPTSITNCASAV